MMVQFFTRWYLLASATLMMNTLPRSSAFNVGVKFSNAAVSKISSNTYSSTRTTVADSSHFVFSGRSSSYKQNRIGQNSNLNCCSSGSSLRTKTSTALGAAVVEDDDTLMKKEESFEVIGNVLFLIPSDDIAKEVRTKFGSNSPVGNPTIMQAITQLSNKIDWFSDGKINASIYTLEQISSDNALRQEVLQTNCLVAYQLTSNEDVKLANEIFQERKNNENSSSSDGDNNSNYAKCQFAIECGDDNSSSSSTLLPMVGLYDSLNPLSNIGTNLTPWSTLASHKRLQEQMISLFERWTTDDFTIAILLYFQLCTPSDVQIPWVQHSIDATWEKGLVQNGKEFYNMISKCGDCIGRCVQDENCRTCLDELTKVDTRDQVMSYRTIVSYESELLRDFSLCILQKNNVFECSATQPKRPYVPPITEWQGRPVTKDVANQLLIAHLKDDDAPSQGLQLDVSWKVACGANVAYDYFPSQNQLFYKAEKGKALWYDPVFRVETIDGRNVWAKRHYKVREGSVPGTFHFSVLDNGITSDEFWTIAGVADDLSWIVFHYSGAASAVGQRYLGGLLCTPDGSLPSQDILENDVWKVLKKTGIEPWELYVVNNDPTTHGAIDAGPPPLDYYRKSILERKASTK